ncbi:MAG: hypothetical protein Q7J65_08545 [Candidatus Marinimicrobia bacterium]|nr:hypothetical protein [Candidatus Neomarinimicrobiota bacterium]
MTEDSIYLEDLCICCGACCGSFDGDPCEHLRRDNEGTYYCDIYENRIGTHRTLSGRVMKCVPIMDKLNEDWIGDHLCAYKRKYLDQE